MPFARIAEHSAGQALAAPVERRDGKAAGSEIAHQFEIFFDEFGTPLKNAYRPLATRWRRPAREPDRDPVGRLENTHYSAFRHRIGRNGNEFHRGVFPQVGTLKDCASGQSLRRSSTARLSESLSAFNDAESLNLHSPIAHAGRHLRTLEAQIGLPI